MYLGIDISEKDTISLLLFGDCAEQSFQREANHRDLVATIDQFLQQHALNIAHIRGIAIVRGEGSFTSSRISTVVGNMIVYTKHIPIIGIEKSAWTSYQENIALLEKQPSGQYIRAIYRSEPHIT